jgi:hypothetical protein
MDTKPPKLFLTCEVDGTSRYVAVRHIESVRYRDNDKAGMIVRMVSGEEFTLEPGGISDWFMYALDAMAYDRRDPSQEP